jgi:hypothetical protein
MTIKLSGACFAYTIPTATWPRSRRMGRAEAKPIAMASNEVMGIASLNPSCTFLGVRRWSGTVDWPHGPICREPPNPPVQRAPT